MKLICQNKKASHDYFLLETFEAECGKIIETSNEEEIYN